MINHNPIDVEEVLRKTLPIIFKLLGEKGFSDKEWLNIKLKYAKEEARRSSIQALGEPYTIELNLYDLIHMANERGSRSAYIFLDLFRKTLEELCDSLDVEGKNVLRKTIYHVLVNYDHKFRNFIGELLVLNNAVKKQQYELLRIEFPILESNRKGEKPPTADFFLKHRLTGEKELVEVVNIHIDDDTKGLVRLLTSKIETKIISKTKNRPDHQKFSLVPVVWASYKTLRQIEKLYSDGASIKIPAVLPPCAFASFDYADDYTQFKVKFGTITTLFKGENIVDDEPLTV